MNPYLMILLTIIIIGALTALYVVSKGSGGVSKQEKIKVKNQLYALSEKVRSPNSSERRDCIIQADSYVSKAMQLKMRNNNSFGENLKELRGFFPKRLYNDIWEAHKKRNRMVHENEDISVTDTEKCYKTFKQSINKLI